MRWICVFLILGACALAQNAYGPDFLNLHCTAPDPLAQTLFNIQPRPGLVPDHAANGNVVIYCDAGSAVMKASYSGGPYVTLGALAFAVDPRTAGSPFDCTGTTAMDTAMQSIASTAHIIIPFGCIIKLASSHTYPQTFEFKQGGQLKPNTGVLITLTGPIIAGSYQIFSNACCGQGGIDFTGNVNTFDIYPEWWGATTTAPAATNTQALQAAIYGAFGCNPSPVTACRTNAANTSFYNKRLYLAGKYSIAGELHWYHTLNFVVQGGGRLQSGIIQTATNSRIIDGQSNAYGVFKDISFSSTASQDLSHPLADFNFDGSQGADLKPQFIDFFNVNWSGGGVTKIGVRIAAAGSSAQGSNFEFWNNLGQSFTEAAYMIGNGSGCSQTALALNAISIEWHGGDMQGNNAFGIEDFGGNNVVWDGGTAENGGDIAFGSTPQTGADFCATGLSAGGGPFSIRNMRSESQTLMSGPGGWELRNVQHLDNQEVPSPGGTGFVGDLIEGSVPCGHGYYNKISVGGTFSGLGTVVSPRTASSGTSTTLVDSVGGLTVNAWTGFNVCIQGGTGINQYCTITSNTATTFTCTAGFFNDFPTAGIVSPDGTTTYTVEPNWGTATTDGGVTFARDDTTYSGVGLANNVFLPGRRFAILDGARYDGVEVTRADFAGFSSPVDAIQKGVLGNIDVGSPTAAGGGQTGIGYSQGYGGLLRTYTLPRNGITEQSFFLRQELGTRVLHWFSGNGFGGISTADAYIGTDSNLPSTKQGDLFISNNSSGTPKKWTFNFDGTANTPGAVITGGTIVGGCTNPTNGVAFPGGGNNSVNIQAGSGNTLALCANGGSATASVSSTGLTSFGYLTNPNCQLGGAAGTTSPAACGNATAGMIAIPASVATYTVNTGLVTANSEIFIQQMSDNSGLPSSPTCNATATNPIQSARVAGTSFTFTLTSTANVTCYKFWLVN